MKFWGVDCWETRSPVSSWLTIHLMFAFSVTYNLASMQLDFTQESPQADMSDDMIMEMDFGHDNPNRDCILKLKKNFYGLCDGNLT